MADPEGKDRGGPGWPDDPLGPNDKRSQRERMLAGDLYMAEDPELTAAVTRASRLQKRYGELLPDDPTAAEAVLHELLGSVGEGAIIRPPLYVDYGTNISIGAGVFVNYGLVALDVLPITIGEDVLIGPNVQLLTATHPMDADTRRRKWEAGEPIVIGRNVWIGGGAIVLPGVTIGENAVVGAGSVVTRDVPAGALVVGNPARVVRKLLEGPG